MQDGLLELDHGVVIRRSGDTFVEVPDEVYRAPVYVGFSGHDEDDHDHEEEAQPVVTRDMVLTNIYGREAPAPMAHDDDCTCSSQIHSAIESDLDGLSE